MTGDLLAQVEGAWREHLRADRSDPSPDPRDYVWASQRRACVRRMALDLMHPEERDEFGDDTLERFAQGNAVEREVYARLMQIGPRCSPPFDVIEGQRHFTVRDRDGSKLITGRIDGRLHFPETGERPVFEIKAGTAIKRVERLEDFDRSPWTRHMPDQLLAYLLAEGEPWGFFVLAPWGGVPRFIRVDLERHLTRAEAFLQDARQAIDARFGRSDLPLMTDDRGECRRCPHLGRSCVPQLDYEGAKVITDPRLIELAETREKTAGAAKDHARADRELKAALRGTESALLGDFQVTGTWQRATKLALPLEVRKKYSVTDEKGRFVLRLERLLGAD